MLPGVFLGSSFGRALGTSSLVGIGQLKHGGNWDPRPEAIRRLLWEIRKRTSIEVRRDADAVDLESNDIFSHPFLILFRPTHARVV